MIYDLEGWGAGELGWVGGGGGGGVKWLGFCEGEERRVGLREGSWRGGGGGEGRGGVHEREGCWVVRDGDDGLCLFFWRMYVLGVEGSVWCCRFCASLLYGGEDGGALEMRDVRKVMLVVLERRQGIAMSFSGRGENRGDGLVVVVVLVCVGTISKESSAAEIGVLYPCNGDE